MEEVRNKNIFDLLAVLIKNISHIHFTNKENCVRLNL